MKKLAMLALLLSLGLVSIGCNKPADKTKPADAAPAMTDGAAPADAPATPPADTPPAEPAK
jgi:hypothetical protein